MREQREPWLMVPVKEPGAAANPRVDPRFRTHVVTVRQPKPMLSEPLPRAPNRAAREPAASEPVLSLAPTPAAIERAAAAAAISRPVPARPAQRRVEPSPPPPPVSRPVEKPAPGAPEVKLDDLAAVSSADWAAKVGEAAKLVDVVVVFYTAASPGSEMFEFAFRTVVNEMLPRLGRPYAVYRFSLDEEPGFVAEMTESLGLAEDNPVTVAGFAWSGPGRRLFLIGDRALESPAVFQRSLRRSLSGQPAPIMRDGGASRRPAASPPSPHARRWGGRLLAVLAWCLFGTAALGAAVVGVAPQWASTLLHPATPAAPAATPKDPPRASDTQTSAVPPVGASLGNPTAGSAGDGGQAAQGSVNPVKPAQTHVRKKRPASTLTANPAYWGLPEDRSR